MFLDLLIWTTLIPSHSLICFLVNVVNTNVNFLFPWKLELWQIVPLSKVTIGLERKLRGQILGWCKLAQFHWSRWKSTNLHVWTSGPTAVINRILPKRNVSRLEKSWNSYFTFHSIHFPSFCEKGVLGCLMKWLALAQFRQSCHLSSLPLSKQAVCFWMACYTASYTQTHAWSGTKWDKLSAYNDLGLQLNTNIHVFVHTI